MTMADAPPTVTVGSAIVDSPLAAVPSTCAVETSSESRAVDQYGLARCRRTRGRGRTIIGVEDRNDAGLRSQHGNVQPAD